MFYCKHLSLQDRQAIAGGLDAGFSFKSIGRVIHKDCTTVAKEVKKNYSVVQVGCWGHRFNNCSYSITCSQSHVCKDCTNRRFIKKCRFCNQCSGHCERYKPAVCRILEKPPYVCNGCKDERADAQGKNISISQLKLRRNTSGTSPKPGPASLFLRVRSAHWMN